MSDGELRSIFRERMPEAMWVTVETWSTGIGVPDCHYCFPSGRAGWIENKKTNTYRLKVQPGQVGWLERYSRMGGRCFVAVRRLVAAGSRKGPAVDELWIFLGKDIRILATDGMQAAASVGVWRGGPAAWDWHQVRRTIQFYGVTDLR